MFDVEYVSGWLYPTFFAAKDFRGGKKKKRSGQRDNKAGSHVMMSPSATSSMMLITADVRTSLAFISLSSSSLPFFYARHTPSSARACLGAHLAKSRARLPERITCPVLYDSCVEAKKKKKKKRMLG